VKPLEIHGQIVRRELPLLLLATGAILIMAMDPMMRGEIGVIDRSDAVILVFLFLIFFYVTALDVLERRSDDSLMVDFDHSRKIPLAASSARDWLSIVVGLTGLLIGGRLTISGGVELAAILNVPSAIVGLFVVAAGTSLPELVTSIIAALRREPDLALGNVIGSNLFNGLAVLPVTALVRPVVVPDGGLLDLAVSFMFAVVLIPIFYVGRARLGRGVGCVFLIAYLAYAVTRLFQG
jgi:cation:H+ antiporter